MKIQAKDLKVGQTVRTGYLTIVIDKIEKGFQKNGTPTITVFGVGTKNGRTNPGWHCTFKENTIVNV